MKAQDKWIMSYHDAHVEYVYERLSRHDAETNRRDHELYARYKNSPQDNGAYQSFAAMVANTIKHTAEPVKMLFDAVY